MERSAAAAAKRCFLLHACFVAQYRIGGHVKQLSQSNDVFLAEATSAIFKLDIVTVRHPNLGCNLLLSQAKTVSECFYTIHNGH